MLLSLSYTNGVDADQEKGFGKTEITITGDSGAILCTEGPLSSNGEQIELISGGERRQISSEDNTGGTTGMFIDLITEEGENPAPPEECEWAVAMTEASFRSAQEKRTMELVQ